MRENMDVIKAARDAGVKMPDVAKALNIGMEQMRQLLRYPLPENTKKTLLSTIEELAGESGS